MPPIAERRRKVLLKSRALSFFTMGKVLLLCLIGGEKSLYCGLHIIVVIP
jgi:hypothetical protein